MQTAPKDAQELISATSAATPSAPGDESGIGDVRLSYIAEADGLGSVPPPAMLTGVLKGGVKLDAGKRPQVFVDKLSERLAFERTGTRLYEALIVKHRAYSDELASVSLARIEEILAEEMRHFDMLRTAIQSLGSDPTAQTPCADVTAVESMGLMQVLTDPRTTFGQSLHAILVAELTDVEGWDMLIRLARSEGHETLAARFEAAREAEETHLVSVRQWLVELTDSQASLAKA
jgi:rubrerythrin